MNIRKTFCLALLLSSMAALAKAGDASESDPRLKPHEVNWGFHAAPKDDPQLPRVLLIGDSVTWGYRDTVIASLAGKANVDCWATALHEASPELHESLQKALAGGTYAVVHFNIGLHGWPKGRIPEGQYESLMRKYVEVVKAGAPHARLIWASTTPVTTKGTPDQLDPAINPIIVERNAIAAKIMKENGIQIDDLYGLMADNLEVGKGDKKNDQFHWAPAGVKLEGDAVARAIQGELASRSAPEAGTTQPATTQAVSDAADFGFSPDATGTENTRSLQRAVDRAGTVVVSRPGTYSISGTVYVGSNTSLSFGDNVFLKKVAEQGPFSHVLLNKGAITRTYDSHITIDGLQIIVNGVDARMFKEAYGLHGQLAFFYAKDIRIRHFRCLDLGPAQYGIQVCTFENLLVDDVIIKGRKDGVHLGRGKRFTIRNGVFQTFDDAIALNGHDYAVGNPELGWIEDGVVENCQDLAAEKTSGYFCRILAGAWIDWHPGMEVQQSDTVVSQGRLYRVQAKPDGTIYKSMTRPTHDSGAKVLDGINWGVVQNDVTYTAGVRNVAFHDIFLRKERISFSIHFDNDKYSRSYYPGAQVPVQQGLTFDNVQVLYGGKNTRLDAILNIATPVDVVTFRNCRLQDNRIQFISNKAMRDYGPTTIDMVGCTFGYPGKMQLIVNGVVGKKIELKTSGSIELSDKFSATVDAGGGDIAIDSDLPGLKK